MPKINIQISFVMDTTLDAPDGLTRAELKEWAAKQSNILAKPLWDAVARGDVACPIPCADASFEWVSTDVFGENDEEIASW